jgi:hypothetical protein
MQFQKALAVVTGMAALLGAGGLAAMEPDPEPVVATWKEAQIDFTYIGRTSFYTCESLREKVARILMAVGARDDLIVRSSGCFGSSDIDTFTRVRIKAAIPVVAEQGGLAPEERSRRELVSRVRGEQPSEEELLQQFPATWQTIRFTARNRNRIVDDGDCELLEQMSYSVFKPLGIEVLRGNNRCIPGEVRYGQLDYQLKALKAAPKPDDAK